MSEKENQEEVPQEVSNENGGDNSEIINEANGYIEQFESWKESEEKKPEEIDEYIKKAKQLIEKIKRTHSGLF